MKIQQEEFAVCPDYVGRCFDVRGYVLDISEYEEFKSRITSFCVEFVDEVGEDYIIVNLSCDDEPPGNMFFKIYGKKEELMKLLD